LPARSQSAAVDRAETEAVVLAVGSLEVLMDELALEGVAADQVVGERAV
jgi:hypothetical protein